MFPTGESVSCSILSSFAIPRTVAHQAPLSVEFSRQQYWCRYPFLSPGYLPNPGIKSRSPALQADSLLSEPLAKLCVKIHRINLKETTKMTKEAF